jgi:cysteine desulfurase family protein (TIGR01976 family)
MLDVPTLRRRFPALAADQIYLDGPAGTQVPEEVIAAITEALVSGMSNLGGGFASSLRSEAVVAAARAAGADLVNGESDEIVFGANMTSLTFSLSRAIAEEWRDGDRIVLSGLDHDANITPWVRAAAGRGVEVAFARLQPGTACLDLDHLESLLDRRVRLVAVTACSNAFGSLVDVSRVAAAARSVGALSYIDAVHLAPHRLIDVTAIGCDFLVCSSYKFFGPHLGMLWGRQEPAERLPAFKVRPAPATGPGRWETGTPPFELLAGFTAAVDYLAGLGAGEDRRHALADAYHRIGEYENKLGQHFLAGLPEGVSLVGPKEGRVPTFALEVAGAEPAEVARHLSRQGIAVWAGHHYAVEPMQRLGYLEAGGLTRIGFVHTNTVGEADAALGGLEDLVKSKS